MLTFEQLTEIETKRREIEQLQDLLNQQRKYAEFGVHTGQGKFAALPRDVNSLIHEVVCKFTVAKIIKLLDECEHLGVDVVEAKQTLAGFLAGLKAEPT
jgi:hypothetical protein